MPVIYAIKEVEVIDFADFCNKFSIDTNKKAGDNGFDEELIINELDKITDEKWLVNFIETKSDGYYRLQVLD